MAISFAISDFVEGGVIAFVILLNIVVGFVQDFKAEKTIQALYALSAPTCKVTRQGTASVIKAEELVAGDVVMLNVGDIVPADLRLVDGLNLNTDEALLTGESLPISKHPDAVLAAPDMPLGDRVNSEQPPLVAAPSGRRVHPVHPVRLVYLVHIVHDSLGRNFPPYHDKTLRGRWDPCSSSKDLHDVYSPT